MSNVGEFLSSQKPQLGATVSAGWKTLAQNEVLKFTKYVRVILPFDGYVFWIRADHLSKSALFNASVFNSSAFDKTIRTITPAPTLTIEGSLHIATDLHQEETKTASVNRVVLTTDQEIQDFHQVGPNVLFLCTFGGIQFAFSSQGFFYEEAQTWHYGGNAVYHDMTPQIINNPAAFDTKNIVVSNSLPLWLTLNHYIPPYRAQPLYPTLTLWPSMLAPQNAVPPYGTVHVLPETTTALTTRSWLDRDVSHFQPARETVRVTLKGLRNFSAQDFIDFVLQYTDDWSFTGQMFGVASMPIVRDEKLGQVELTALSETKAIDFEVNYTQTRQNNLVRQLILKAVVNYYPRALAAS
jgi:hypothetical protein